MAPVIHKAMAKEKVYHKHEFLCALSEEKGDAFAMTLTAVTMDKPNSIKLQFKSYKELKELAQYILSLAYDLKHPEDDINLKDIAGQKIVKDSDGVTHIYPNNYGKDKI